MTTAPVLGEPVPVELMNTVWADRHGVYDALATTDEAIGWLGELAPGADDAFRAELEALTARQAATTARSLRRLRDALRDLAADATGDQRPVATAARPGGAAGAARDVPAAAAEVNRLTAAAPRWLVLDPDDAGGWRRTVASPRGPAEVALAALAERAVELFTAGTREQLRACGGPGCTLYFVKQHARREWCSTGCGNRARVARHYQRHHADLR